MRIVIDLQAAQSDSRHRGIGRYTLAISLAIARNPKGHEIIIALNGLFPETIEPIRAAFFGILPQESICVWEAAGPIQALKAENRWRKKTAELVRENFLIGLEPDVVFIPSMFEGFGDDSALSIGLLPSSIKTAVTSHDLIPLIHSETYLEPSPTYKEFYLEKLAYFKQADLYLAVSESSRQEVIENLNIPGEIVTNTAEGADAHFKPLNLLPSERRSILKSFHLSRDFIMYSGATDSRKNHLRLIKAFSILPISLRKNYQLAIVGHLPDEHREKFNKYADLCGLSTDELIITGRVTDEQMVKLYNICKLFVFPSWHEGFGLPALEAMACGAPVIGSNTSSLPEVIGRADALFDPFDEKSISQKILDVLTDDVFRNSLIKHSLQQATNFSWEKSAATAISAFEKLNLTRKSDHIFQDDVHTDSKNITHLIEKIGEIENPPIDEIDWIKTAKSIAQNRRISPDKQLLVDISELVQRDAKSGIQRVVRSVLAELLNNPPQGFKVEPVYATQNELGYRYARNFARNFLNTAKTKNSVNDEPVEFFNGDIFLGLDLQHHVVIKQASLYANMRNLGTKVYFIVYDLLPVLLPHVFSEGMENVHSQWLSTLSHADGALCISRAVADEMIEWLKSFGPKRLRPFKVNWFHLGADMAGSLPTKGFPENASRTLNLLSQRPTFLMVGTIEPRKGQMQTLAAFEKLWHKGVDINLVMVGKHGWNVDLLTEMLRNHSELDRRLFWLESITDEFLEKVYSASSCLIAASEGEGFGLPLIEAAQHRIPIIARDIPVFREVAGEYAFYFSGLESEELALAVQEWLLLNKKNKTPRSDQMPWLTWKQSTQNLLKAMLSNDSYEEWMPDDVLRFWGNDNRLGTQVGKRGKREICTTSRAGYLVFGPYISLITGRYRVKVFGTLNINGLAGARMDVATKQGHFIVADSPLNTPDKDNCFVTLSIDLEEPCNDLEIRIFVTEKSDIQIHKIEISSITDQPH